MITSDVHEMMNGTKMEKLELKNGYVQLNGVGIFEGKFGVKRAKSSINCRVESSLLLSWNVVQKRFGVERCDVTCSTFFRKGADADIQRL